MPRLHPECDPSVPRVNLVRWLVPAVATDLGIDYRLIGGNSVALLVRVHDAATQVPDRATADADMGVSFEVSADPRLVPALGYHRQSVNRFIRTQGTRPWPWSSMSSPRHTSGA
jgi:hypothetical protein